MLAAGKCGQPLTVFLCAKQTSKLESTENIDFPTNGLKKS